MSLAFIRELWHIFILIFYPYPNITWWLDRGVQPLMRTSQARFVSAQLRVRGNNSVHPGSGTAHHGTGTVRGSSSLQLGTCQSDRGTLPGSLLELITDRLGSELDSGSTQGSARGSARSSARGLVPSLARGSARAGVPFRARLVVRLGFDSGLVSGLGSGLGSGLLLGLSLRFGSGLCSGSTRVSACSLVRGSAWGSQRSCEWFKHNCEILWAKLEQILQLKVGCPNFSPVRDLGIHPMLKGGATAQRLGGTRTIWSRFFPCTAHRQC